MAGTKASGGRGAVAVATHRARGTFQPVRHADHENPEPPKGTPDIPMPLEGLAAEEWARMLVRLELCGCLSKVDDASIYQYCQLFAETEQLSRKQAEVDQAVDRLEESAADSDLEVKDRMALYLEIGKMRQLEAGYDNKIRQGRMALRQWLVEFGLTPAARSRVKLSPKQKDDEDSEMFGGPRGVVGRR